MCQRSKEGHQPGGDGDEQPPHPVEHQQGGQTAGVPTNVRDRPEEVGEAQHEQGRAGTRESRRLALSTVESSAPSNLTHAVLGNSQDQIQQHQTQYPEENPTNVRDRPEEQAAAQNGRTRAENRERRREALETNGSSAASREVIARPSDGQPTFEEPAAATQTSGIHAPAHRKERRGCCRVM